MRERWILGWILGKRRGIEVGKNVLIFSGRTSGRVETLIFCWFWPLEVLYEHGFAT
jgi:hypothetical protein